MAQPSAKKHLDLPRLARLLAMLGSPNDAEALAAARKASELVNDSDRDWFALLGCSSSHTDPVRIAAAQAVLHRTQGGLHPPVGNTWVTSLRYLCAQRESMNVPPGLVDWRHWNRLLAELERQTPTEPTAITPRDAADVLLVYNLHRGTPGGAPV